MTTAWNGSSEEEPVSSSSVDKGLPPDGQVDLTIATDDDTLRANRIRCTVAALLRHVTPPDSCEPRMPVGQFSERFGAALLRLAAESPWEDVRAEFTDFVARLPPDYKAHLLPGVDCNLLLRSVTPPDPAESPLKLQDSLDSPARSSSFTRLLGELRLVSRFIPTCLLPSTSTTHEPLRTVFKLQYLKHGRIPNLIRTLGLYPEYSRLFLATHDKVMEAGPLLASDRHYLAIIAAGTHRCTPLMEAEKQLFRAKNGDAAWLRSIDGASPKMQLMAEFNGLLAHGPWWITVEDIRTLMGGGWTLAQIAHATLIMTTYHMLAGIIFGCGIIADDEPTYEDPRSSSAYEDGWNSDCSDKASEVARVLGVDPSNEPADAPEFEMALQNDADDRGDASAPEDRKFFAPNKHGVTRYIDFDCHSREYNLHNLSEFTWRDGGINFLDECSLLDQAQALQEEFTHVKTMTSRTFGDMVDVDTSKFRRMVWLYTHRVYGIIHDDYNYSQINTLFKDKSIVRMVKSYIKRTAVTPETLSKQHWDDAGSEFLRPEEKCHVCLLTCEARRQGAMVFALKALSQAAVG